MARMTAEARAKKVRIAEAELVKANGQVVRYTGLLAKATELQKTAAEDVEAWKAVPVRETPAESPDPAAVPKQKVPRKVAAPKPVAEPAPKVDDEF